MKNIKFTGYMRNDVDILIKKPKDIKNYVKIEVEFVPLKKEK